MWIWGVAMIDRLGLAISTGDMAWHGMARCLSMLLEGRTGTWGAMDGRRRFRADMTDIYSSLGEP